MRSFSVILLASTIFCAFSHQHQHHEHVVEHDGADILTQYREAKLEVHEHEDKHEHGHEHEHEHGHEYAAHDHSLNHQNDQFERKNHTKSSKTQQSRLTTFKVWAFSLSSVIGISLAPCTLLFCIPSQHTNGPLLKILLAFGAGGLLGDALLHIIPHSLSPHHHSHGHDDHSHRHDHSHNDDHSHDHSNQLRVGVYVIAGVLVFMMVEQLVRIIKGGHCHSHENGHIVADEHRHLNDHSDHIHEHEGNGSKQKKKHEVEGLKDVKASAYLNLVADFVHNVTDGLAIGASFSAGSTLGWITTLTVLLHELPHEVGDYAILVQSGFSKYQAIRMQAVTALGAITGCIFSLLISNPGSVNNEAENSAIMPFTAGGFIYIATVSVIPELLESGDHNNMSKIAKMAQSLVHVIAICMGVAMMYIVSLVE